MPAAQIWPAWQAVPQAPQFCWSDVSVAQYGAPASPEHFCWPEGQDKVQAPEEQTWPALQVLPQAPQF